MAGEGTRLQQKDENKDKEPASDVQQWLDLMMDEN
jgi:hypothetical protein